MQKTAITLLTLLLFIACSKDDLPPVITITSPANNQSFTSGQTVNVVATITDEEELHEVALYVINNDNNKEILHFHDHVDVKNYNLNKSFTVQAGITYRIKVQSDDHAGNQGLEQILVKAQ